MIDSQYFNCKFKEVDGEICQLKKEVDRIKKDLSMTHNRDRGFSPYSQESIPKENPNLLSSLRQSIGRAQGAEHHFGYQDICTPEISMTAGPPISKTNRNLSLNCHDSQGNSRVWNLLCSLTTKWSQLKTFEDLMRKNRLEIDCNINNCRNNQNTFSLRVCYFHCITLHCIAKVFDQFWLRNMELAI